MQQERVRTPQKCNRAAPESRQERPARIPRERRRRSVCDSAGVLAASQAACRFFAGRLKAAQGLVQCCFEPAHLTPRPLETERRREAAFKQPESCLQAACRLFPGRSKAA
eukprot:1985798-Alexandrium_andersonii.AAC.1